MVPISITISDEEMPQARLGLLLQHFSALEDGREPCVTVTARRMG